MNVQSKVPNYVIAPAPIPTIPVVGTDQVFPIRRVYCVGRNYAEHAIEMGHDPNREPPFFFQKNPDNVVLDGKFPYPPKTSDVHHEIELVVALGKGGADIPAEKALDYVFGYAVGLDMTRRDLQGEAKKMGRPWEVGKAVEASAPCGPIVPASKIGHPSKGAV
ncbi:MAG TPA: fumarylacetoacetate hydrolase family protein, partial [Beijerinckiaceae bacterium]|nr:fumarylacetoacetate hydrolase family protein [Beijerinckiaceae bacterium]